MNYLKSKLNTFKNYVLDNTNTITCGIHWVAVTTVFVFMVKTVINEMKIEKLEDAIKELDRSTSWIENETGIHPY